MRSTAWAGLLAPLLALGPADASVDARLSPEVVTVGDPVEVILEIPVDPGGREPSLPAPFEHWGEAEVTHAEKLPRTEEENGETAPGTAATTRFRIEVRSFRPGPVVLPPISLSDGEPTVEEWVTPTELGFQVDSVLPTELAEGETIEPRPFAPPRALPRRHLDRWILGGLGTAALLAGILYWRRRQIGDDVVAKPSEPPIATLKRELNRLAELDATETVHVELSRALRHYLEGTAGVPAPERTTAEIRRALLSSVLSGDVSRGYVRLLRDCDGVKFARLEVPAATTRERLRTARSLAEATEAELAALRPPPTEEAA